MAVQLRSYLITHISDHEHLSKTYATTAADQSLPQTTRDYWQRQSNEHIIKAETYRTIFRALEHGEVTA